MLSIIALTVYFWWFKASDRDVIFGYSLLILSYLWMLDSKMSHSQQTLGFIFGKLMPKPFSNSEE